MSKSTLFQVPASLLALGIFSLIFILTSCKIKVMNSDTNYNHIFGDSGRHYNYKDNFDSTQIIFWKKGESKRDFEKFQRNFEKEFNPDDKLVCGNCNEDVIIYHGENIPTYYTTQTSGSGGSGSGGKSQVTGDGDTIYWSANFKMKYNDSTYANGSLIILPPPKQTSTIKTVAVFDTGVDTSGIPQAYFYTSNTTSCLGEGANNGWNFVNNTPNWKDDNSIRHGTIVSRFIINEVNAYNTGTGVKILPVKTHDSTGEGDLFGVLCAISYAADRKADIVNASFGFYKSKNPATIDSAAIFLKEYIDYYLTGNNILFIAAAGNVTPQYSQRDLNIVSFYPASLSRNLNNVFAVTTIDTGGNVATDQNFSDTIVNIGVNADVIINQQKQQINAPEFFFFNPRIAGGLVSGSSFATPIVTGNVCAHYNSLLGSGALTKPNLLNTMHTNNWLTITNPRLEQFIAGNNAMLKKAKP